MNELCVLIDVRFIFRHYVSYVIYSTISVLSLNSSEVLKHNTQVLTHIFVCSIFLTENLYKVMYTKFQFPWCRWEFRSMARLGSKVLSIRSSPSILLINSELHWGHFAPLRNSVIMSTKVSSCKRLLAYWLLYCFTNFEFLANKNDFSL